MTEVPFYVLIIAIFASLPIILDICLSYHSLCKTRELLKNLIEKASLDKLDMEELKEFIREIGKPPSGIRGLARATMAFTVILVLGVSVFYVLVRDGSGSNSQIINSILSMLAGLLAAITGFYFGGRASEKREEDEKRRNDTGR